MIRSIPWLLLAAPSADAAGWPDLSVPPRGTASGGSADAAVIIGIEDYVMEGVPDIAGAEQGARDWYGWFRDAHGIPSTRIQLRLNEEATDHQIREAASRAAALARKGGTLWFVYLGHGAPAKDGSDGLLVGADASASAAGIYQRSVPRSEIADLLGQGSQARTVMVLDACFSGRTASGDALVEGLQPLVPVSAQVDSAVTMLTATQRDQFAGPLPGAARPAFSYLLLGALRGWGDSDRDGRVSAAEALAYARDALLTVVTDRTQEPELVGPGASWILSEGTEVGPDLGDLVLGGTTQPVARMGSGDLAGLGFSPLHLSRISGADAGSGAAEIAQALLDRGFSHEEIASLATDQALFVRSFEEANELAGLSLTGVSLAGFDKAHGRGMSATDQYNLLLERRGLDIAKWSLLAGSAATIATIPVYMKGYADPNDSGYGFGYSLIGVASGMLGTSIALMIRDGRNHGYLRPAFMREESKARIQRELSLHE